MNLVTEQEGDSYPTCLIVMPLQEVNPYESGHFRRVYEYLLKPACVKAGFIPQLSDDVTHHRAMAIDSLRRVAGADVVIFDLTTKDPNVLYQLGIRQALEKPYLLVKDSLTTKLFDIQGVLEIEYKENLRIDTVTQVITSIAEYLQRARTASYPMATRLGVAQSPVSGVSKIRSELDDLISAIYSFRDRLSESEPEMAPAEARNENAGTATGARKKKKKEESWVNEAGNVFQVGDIVTHPKFGLGIIVEIEPEGNLSVKFHTIGVKSLKGEVEKLQLL